MEEGDILQPGVSIKPLVTLDDAKIIVNDLYDFKIENIKELNSYDDKNYYILVNKDYNSSENCEFVLKIINSLDSKNPQFVEAQNSLLIHLGKNGIKCSKPVLNKNGQYYSIKSLPSGEHIVRLLEYINGTILHQLPSCQPYIFYQVGQFIAKVDSALKDFHHAAYDKLKTLWMLESLPRLPEFLYAVNSEKRRKLVEDVISQFSNRVLTISDSLEHGMIHGDFNEQNIIVNEVNKVWKVDAIIDFGDSQYSCYLYELAVTMTYMILEGKDIDVGGYVLAGYTSIRELSEREQNLLKVCIAARLCQSLVLGAYSYLQDPGNSYILTTAAHGWNILEKLWAEPEDKLLLRWKSIDKKLEYH